MRGLKGKNVLVTGGSSGIGQAIAVRFAEYGANVAINYLREREEADDTEQQVEACVSRVKQEGVRHVLVRGDVSKEDEAIDMVAQAVEGLRGLDVLVNNAAYQMTQDDISEITTEQFDRVMKTNLYAMFWLCKAAIPHLQPGSSILNTSSVQAYQPSPTLLDYATTKAGIVNFSKGLSQELAPKGIRVNTVAPGPIWTPLIPATMPAEQVEDFGGETPLGRAGQPVEVAHAFVFLASAEASYITGERLGVHGGMPLP